MFKWLFILLASSLVSCQYQSKFEISSFEVLSNFETPNDTLILEMDLSKGPFRSITLPSQSGRDGSKVFEFQFEIENTTNEAQQFGYKIFYQNESYKKPETNALFHYNPSSSENFYGSWISDSASVFHLTDVLEQNSKTTITDQFTISGNPLNLEVFFGANPLDIKIEIADVRLQAENIMNIPDWFESIEKKAKENKKDIERQLMDDALWTLENKDHGIRKNQRWQNNPRVGCYKFMLVIAPKATLNNLPDFIQDLASTDASQNRVNPFYYFNYGLNEELIKEIEVIHSASILKTYAVLRPDNGLYYNHHKFTTLPEIDDPTCSYSDEQFEKAHFFQHISAEVKDSSLHNVDLIATVGGSNYSRDEFEENKNNAKRNIPSYVHLPDQPCKNAFYNEAENCIQVVNPGNTERPYQKENAGIEGRFGFTYGKFRARIKFPETLSEEGVWNGITCAYWLKFQSDKAWNKRDICTGSGYLKSGYSKEEAVYSPETTYSEIDIEIVKTSRNWPMTSYDTPDTVNYYDAGADDNLMITCTNWDLACDEPSDFSSGVQSIHSETEDYLTHRWTNYYKAITIKTENPSKETVGSIYLYEIDWQPESITWRIGKDVDAMKEIGFMDKTVTKIPNNQMVPVMSQEFHYGHWWPMAPYSQGDIPYPASPISGALYEIVIE